MAAHIVAQLE